MGKSYLRNNFLLLVSLIIISAAYSMISETSHTMQYLSIAVVFIMLFAMVVNLIYFVPGINKSLKFVLPGLIHMAVIAIVYHNQPEFKFFMIGGILRLLIGVWSVIEINGMIKENTDQEDD